VGPLLRCLLAVPAHPGVQPAAVPPYPRDTVSGLGRRDPPFEWPPLPVDQVLVAQQLGAGVVLCVGAGDTLELASAHLISLFLEGCDDLVKLPAGSIVRDRLAKTLQLRRVHHVPAARRNQTLGIQRNVPTAGGAGVDVQLVGRLVGREADVPVWSREMSATELRLEVGEQRDHRSFDFVFVLVSVRIEICLRVVRAQPAKEALEVATPTGKLASHRGKGSWSRASTTSSVGPSSSAVGGR